MIEKLTGISCRARRPSTGDGKIAELVTIIRRKDYTKLVSCVTVDSAMGHLVDPGVENAVKLS